MTTLHIVSLLSYAILLWGATIAIFNTFISAGEVVFARAKSDHRR
ncbi:MAG: hypothetical protein P8X95_00475 [Anaerolineales bacterium]